MITLQKVPSFGFIFSVNEMAKYAPEVQDINLEDYLDMDFNTVNGELFVKAYNSPREGICLRIDNDKVLECFNLKTKSFASTECLLIDAGEVDIEMLDNYVAQGDENIIEDNNG